MASSSQSEEMKEYTTKKIQGFLTPKSLGSGRMSKIFRGKMEETEIAIKIYKKSNRIQWEAEKKLLTACRHSNIVQLLGYGSSNDTFYLLLELIEGSTLQKAIKDLDWPTLPKILSEILKGLTAIHEAGFVVGDIKPDNIMLTQAKEVKLIDFGSASNETVKVIHCCTPGYAAPEVDTDDKEKIKEISEQSDIFSFGVILLQLLTSSEKANTSLRQLAVEAKQNKTHIVSENLIKSGCTEDQAKTLMDLGLKCTEKEPKNRGDHKSARDTLELLKATGQRGERKKQKKQKK